MNQDENMKYDYFIITKNSIDLYEKRYTNPVAILTFEDILGYKKLNLKRLLDNIEKNLTKMGWKKS